MDQTTLVNAGRIIITELTTRKVTPRAAVWVRLGDSDTWKLWIVPPGGFTDDYRFYRMMASIVSKRRQELGGIDAADVKLVSEDHPAIKGLRRAVKATDGGIIFMKDNVLFGFYLPEAIVLEMNF
ncbi:MAG TPA: hypothetical protein VHT03_12275 [Rhizomicrobium sp.]|jgi:hypothetical protein|nr:hypothetical protein [Rhizomicrobium sp.]